MGLKSPTIWAGLTFSLVSVMFWVTGFALNNQKLAATQPIVIDDLAQRAGACVIVATVALLAALACFICKAVLDGN